MSTDDSTEPRFEEVDWSSVSGRSVPLSLEDVTFLLLAAGLLAGYLYDVYVVTGHDPTLYVREFRTAWDVSQLDWLTMATGIVAIAYVGVPVVRTPSLVRDFWREYPKDVLSLSALGYTTAFVLVGVFGPVVVGEPTLNFDHSRQPPLGVGVHMKHLVTCLGPVDGNLCYGTARFPLGTTRAGEDVVAWVVYGARTAVQFALLSGALLVPVATVVGTVSGYFGGRVDAVLTRYVEVQVAVPTIIIYFVLVRAMGPTLFALVVAYGLFNWGDVAQVVRGEARSLREEEYVMAARSAGADRVSILRHHLVPNVTPTVVASLSLLVPKLILIEALYSFIGLSGDKSYSWGQLIQRGLKFEGMRQLESLWWIAVVPGLAILVTVFWLSILGEALQDVFDPRR